MYDYLREPEAIYRRSFELVRRETDLSSLSPAEQSVALRLVHACGMPEIVADLEFHPDAVAAGRAALAGGAVVLADCEMVASGISLRSAAGGSTVRCTLNDPRVAADAAALGTTRSAAAVERWRDHLAGAVVAIGNAPTALFHLLERLHDGWPRPALILAFPVGFVGAAESKAALCSAATAVPFITLKGRRGGSALAAAAVNALAVQPSP